jgi:hypothetical protein
MMKYLQWSSYSISYSSYIYIYMYICIVDGVYTRTSWEWDLMGIDETCMAWTDWFCVCILIPSGYD